MVLITVCKDAFKILDGLEFVMITKVTREWEISRLYNYYKRELCSTSECWGLGVRILCRHNFQHNWFSTATSIMLA